MTEITLRHASKAGAITIHFNEADRFRVEGANPDIAAALVGLFEDAYVGSLDASHLHPLWMAAEAVRRVLPEAELVTPPDAALPEVSIEKGVA